MPSIEVNGGNVVYEILGDSGDLIALTPGGRFSKEIDGLRPLAEALAAGGYRVLLWDRPNCGASDVQFYGQSESHMRAETLQEAGDRPRLRAVHPCRRLRWRKGFHADHDALPRTRREAGGVEHRRRHLRQLRARLLLHHPQHSRGARHRHGRRGEGARNGASASRRTRPTSSGSSTSTKTSSSR